MSAAEAQANWQLAKYIFLQSRLLDVRRSAREIALSMEKLFTVPESIGTTAEDWSI